MAIRNWKTTVAAFALAGGALVALLPKATIWAQPYVGSQIYATPQPTPMETPAPIPKPAARSMAPMAAAVVTRKYTRDPAIQVGQLHVEGKRTLAFGEKVHLWIDTPVDYDSYTEGTVSDRELDDTLFGKWTGGGDAGNFSTTSGYDTTWTAPNRVGTYVITLTVNDDLSRGSTNGRNDVLNDDNKITLTVVHKKVWDEGDQLTGGEVVKPANQGTIISTPIYLHENDVLDLEVSPATDSDHWVRGSENDTEDDNVKYAWKSTADAGAFSAPTAAATHWQAPPLPTLSNEFPLVLTVTIEDDPKDIGDDGGTRDDSNTSKITRNIFVVVTRKKWDEGATITGAEVVKPEIDSPEGTVVPIVEQGAIIDVEVSEAIDSDHWKDGLLENTEDDEVTYSWHAVGPYGGVFSAPDSRTTQWTAPALPPGMEGTLVDLVLSVNDKPKLPGVGEGGTRDDVGGFGMAPLTQRITIQVKRPMWDKVPQIGQYRLTEGPNVGQLAPNGRMIAPQDQRNSYDSSQEIPIAPGARVPVEVEGATDLDTLTAVNGTTNEAADEVSYQWEAVPQGAGGKGTWEWQVEENGQMVTKNGVTAPTSKALWIAPTDIAKATKYTLECTIDDKPLAINSPTQGGDRDDNSIVRTVKIKVSSASLSLDLTRKTADATSTDAATYSPIGSGSVGGQVYAAVNLTIGQGIKVSSGNALVRFYEKPDTASGVNHPESENHIDAELKFNDKTGWQKFYDPDGNGGKKMDWWDAPEAPNVATSNDGEVRYRYLMLWDTKQAVVGTRFDNGQMVPGNLYGHNGEHEVSFRAVDSDLSARIAFTSAYGGSYKSDKPESKDATVSNLTLSDVSTNNGTKDYFKFDPESTTDSLLNPTVEFKIADTGDYTGHAYRWRLRARNTNDVNDTKSIVYEGIAPSPRAVTVTINGSTLAAEGSPLSSITLKSTYNFEVSVREYTSVAAAQAAIDQSGQQHEFIEGESIDSTKLRSIYLFIPYNMPAPNADKLGHDGHMVDDWENNKVDWYLSHYFQDSKRQHEAVPQAKVHLLKPDMSDDDSEDLDVQTNQPTFERKIHTYAYDDFVFNKVYIAVTTAMDDHKSDYRDHQAHSILAKNNQAEILNPDVDYEGDYIACAGGHYTEQGVDRARMDDAHTATILATVLNKSITPSAPVTNQVFQVVFVSNATEDGAQFVKADGTVTSEPIEVSTNDHGKASFKVLSSRKIGNAKIQMKQRVGSVAPYSWKPTPQTQVITFAAPESKRLFGVVGSNPFFEDDNGWTNDTGWLFEPQISLDKNAVGPPTSAANEYITCRIFLRFRKNTFLPINKNYYTINFEPVEVLDASDLDTNTNNILEESELASVKPNGSAASPLLYSLTDDPKQIWYSVGQHKLRVKIAEASIPNEAANTVAAAPLSSRVATFCADPSDGTPTAGQYAVVGANDSVTYQAARPALPTYLPVTTNADGMATFYVRRGDLSHRATQIKFTVEDMTTK